jgi:hypothetical protein
MKTILVPAGGSASDDVTFETAYAAAHGILCGGYDDGGDKPKLA